MNELQTFESISRLGKQMASINSTDRASSLKNCAPKKFAKKKVGRTAKTEIKVWKPIFKKNVELLKLKDAKEKCFYCHEQGYWKKNYPKYLEELKVKKDQGNVPLHFIHVLELNYIDNSNYSWIIDSGATNHVCSSLHFTYFWTWE